MEAATLSSRFILSRSAWASSDAGMFVGCTCVEPTFLGSLLSIPCCFFPCSGKGYRSGERFPYLHGIVVEQRTPRLAPRSPGREGCLRRCCQVLRGRTTTLNSQRTSHCSLQAWDTCSRTLSVRICFLAGVVQVFFCMTRDRKCFISFV